jgi:hypothetical protein
LNLGEITISGGNINPIMMEPILEASLLKHIFVLGRVPCFFRVLIHVTAESPQYLNLFQKGQTTNSKPPEKPDTWMCISVSILVVDMTG